MQNLGPLQRPDGMRLACLLDAVPSVRLQDAKRVVTDCREDGGSEAKRAARDRSPLLGPLAGSPEVQRIAMERNPLLHAVSLLLHLSKMATTVL